MIEREDQYAEIQDDEILIQPESRWPKYLIRILSLVLAIAFLLMASYGTLSLLGMPSLTFLLESGQLARDPQIKAYMQAVVMIKAGNSGGTGFNIDPEGLVVTCNHVVEGADQIRVSFSATAFQDIDQWKVIPEIDLAIVALDQQNLPFLELETDRQPEPKDAVIVIGNPLGLFRVVNRATVLGYVELTGWNVPVMMIQGSVYKGNSGSPVINSDGKVVGVIFATAEQDDSQEIIAFAIPVSEIIKQILIAP